MKLAIFLFCISIFFENWLIITAVDYCDESLCNNGVHIACNHTGEFSDACSPNAKIVPLTKPLRKMIVDRHNIYRNTIAMGTERFISGARMATIQWSPELAKLATLNVMQCAMKHDECRNTNSYRYSGQNLATRSGSVERDIETDIRYLMHLWWQENKYANMTYMNSYSTPTDGKVIGHFTQLVQERNKAVGCGYVVDEKDGMFNSFLACNYAYTNIISMPVYTMSNKSGSKCTTGMNSKFKYLCSVREKYKLT